MAARAFDQDVTVPLEVKPALQSLSQKSLEPQFLVFKDLSYNVQVTKKVNGVKTRTTLEILKGVTGSARTGELMAVMGPSGAGKSTFLDAVAGRIAPASLQGQMVFNGQTIHPERFKRISAYVYQSDQLFGTLTVAETLLFSAAVRLPPSVSRAERAARVDGLLGQLGLERVRNTLVGDEDLRGISGGEKRRVSIGVDIIHDPPVVFLDEPTSGLDSTSAFYVMEKLQKIAQSGSLVMATIHQPSFRILDLLDQLLVLARGQVAYLGSPRDLPGFLAGAGCAFPEHANAAEVIIDLVEDRGSPEANPVVARLVEAMATRQKQGLAAVTQGALLEGAQEMTRYSKYANPFHKELSWLMWRVFVNIKRSPPLFIIRIINALVTGVLLASIFWKPNEGLLGAKNYVSFFVFLVCALFFTSNDALPSFIVERQIFLREASHFAYRASAYTIANMVVFLPFLALLAMIIMPIVFWTVGLAGGAGSFFFHFLVMLLSFFLANSFVSFLSALVPNVVIGNTVSLALTAYMLLLSGFFIIRTKIPKYWIWFHYMSSLKYSYEAMVLEQFDRDSCWAEGFQTDLTYKAGSDSSCKLTGT